MGTGGNNVPLVFQSTLSMRRATIAHVVHSLPHSISIHALHEESDSSDSISISTPNVFQSTLSMRRATHDSRTWRVLVLNFNPRSP